MSFRFWRRVRLAPGITLNLSKSAASFSFGPRGAKYTMGTAGTRATAGIPGTGLFYTVQNPGKARGRRGRGRGGHGSEAPDAPPVASGDRLDLGFFQRLMAPAEEEALVDGWRAMTQGKEDAARLKFEEAAGLADGAYMAGFLHLKQNALEAAERHLGHAYANRKTLGRYFDKYGVAPRLSMAITDTVTVHVEVDERAILLALVEIYQQQARWQDAVATLHDLRRYAPELAPAPGAG